MHEIREIRRILEELEKRIDRSGETKKLAGLRKFACVKITTF